MLGSIKTEEHNESSKSYSVPAAEVRSKENITEIVKKTEEEE